MIWRPPRLRAAALLALLLAVSISPAALQWPAWKIAAGLVLCAVAALIAIEDLSAMTVPDWGAALIALVAIGLQLMDGATAMDVAISVGLGAMTALVLFIVTWLYGLVRGIDVLGFGDVKLVGASAVLVGPWGIALQLTIASMAAIIFVTMRALRKKRRLRATSRIPFGTFLAPAAIIVWAWLPTL